MTSELAILLFVVAMIGVVWRYAADRKHVRKLQQDATRAFASIAVESQVQRHRLIGATAVVERREEVGGVRGIFERTADFAVTIYARNEFGEKFLFKWHSKSKQSPHIKHLPQRDAL